ncbi:MAG TPA: extracellular solute-binding protein [Chloroflexota bacterium]|jgi:iron(III) transport system substrate-binding protein
MRSKWTRSVLGFLLLLTACAPAAAPAKPAASAPAAAPPAAQPAPPQPANNGGSQATAGSAPAASSSASADWDQTLAAAKQEGKVLVAGAPGSGYRDAMRAFEAKYPDIKLEYQGFGAIDFQARFASERRADQYLWDVYINGPTTFDITAKQEGGFVSLRSALLLPEVRDESAWFGGFPGAFLDSEKEYVFSFQAESTPQAYVNRDVIPESELSTIQQLTDPKWKGKIAFHDPRVDGAGNGRVAAWTSQLGEDWVRALLRQDVVLTQDYRQLAEWIVRGRYPIALGIGGGDLFTFQQEGLGKNVLPLGGKTPEAWRLSSGFGVVRLLSHPPNPNAAKVFVNWLLSKEGQTEWVTKGGRASRRLDAPVIESLTPDPEIKYFDIDREETLPLRDRAKEISKDVLGPT